MLISLTGGCASNSDGPELLMIAASDYDAVFDAAVEAARREGLSATMRDRRGGVIDTLPRVAGSALEPWRTDNASIAQSFENTVAYQRRRARFEFAPAGFNPPEDAASTKPLAGPDVINAQQAPMDLTMAEGNLELRVWVYLERASTPGQRRSTWSRSKTTQAVLVHPQGMKERRGATVNWTPVARDPDYERRLLGAVQHILAASAASSPQSQPLARNLEPVAAQAE